MMPIGEQYLSPQERSRLRVAMACAPKKLPKELAKMVATDISAWEEFGFRFGYWKQIQQVAEEIIALPDILESPPPVSRQGLSPLDEWKQAYIDITEAG